MCPGCGSKEHLPITPSVSLNKHSVPLVSYATGVAIPVTPESKEDSTIETPVAKVTGPSKTKSKRHLKALRMNKKRTRKEVKESVIRKVDHEPRNFLKPRFVKRIPKKTRCGKVEGATPTTVLDSFTVNRVKDIGVDSLTEKELKKLNKESRSPEVNKVKDLIVEEIGRQEAAYAIIDWKEAKKYPFLDIEYFKEFDTQPLTPCRLHKGGVRKNQWEFKCDIYRLRGVSVQVAGVYSCANEAIDFLCTMCGHIWSSLPSSMCKRPYGGVCPCCKSAKRLVTVTPNQHILDVKNVHGNKLWPLDPYVRSNIRIRYICCEGHIWSDLPGNILQGYGCRKCYAKSRTKTNEQHIMKVKEIHGNTVWPLDTYIKADIRIHYTCCESHVWLAFPSSVESGTGCSICFSNSRILDPQEVLERLIKVHGNKYTFLSPYINSNTYIEVVCNKDGYRWKARASDLLSGSGCMKCAISSRGFSHEEYVSLVFETHGNNVNVLGKFEKTTKRLLHACPKGHTWLTTPNSILYNKSGCPRCKGLKPYYLDEYVQKLIDCGNKFITLEDYVNNSTKIWHQCTKCGHKRKMSPHQVINQNVSCINCTNKSSYSNESISWLTQEEKRLNIKIRKATSPDGEFHIQTCENRRRDIRVDGILIGKLGNRYKVVFEYEGSHVHGDPNVFGPDDQCSPYNDKPAKVLLAETLSRRDKILKKGYVVIYLWSSAWKHYTHSKATMVISNYTKHPNIYRSYAKRWGYKVEYRKLT